MRGAPRIDIRAGAVRRSGHHRLFARRDLSDHAGHRRRPLSTAGGNDLRISLRRRTDRRNALSVRHRAHLAVLRRARRNVSPAGWRGDDYAAGEKNMKALIGGTIYPNPTDEPIGDGVVLIDGDTIASVGTSAPPPEATIIDCSGLTITAGFWNSHV